MDKVRGQIGSLADSQWTENLYWSWLYSFRPLLEPKAANSGYPSFMTNQAWTRKDLNTVNGSYTELKHDTILYAKQVDGRDGRWAAGHHQGVCRAGAGVLCPGSSADRHDPRWPDVERAA